MNRDTYTLEQRFLAWLIQEPDTEAALLKPKSDDAVNASRSLEGQDKSLFKGELADPLDLEDFADESWTLGFRNVHQAWDTIPRSSGHEPLKLGAKFVVQERFHTLLKQRFQQELQANPPLFPWEDELMEYEDGPAFSLAGLEAWKPQLESLRLPVALPAEVMAQVFEKCQSLAKSTVQDGRRLVAAVEGLFPNQGEPLNALAGSMLLGYARDGEGMASRLLGRQVPEAYETATPEQQMTLAMIAAYEVLSRLTLKLSEIEPAVSQSWETSVGRVNLHAVREGHSLRLEAQLPVAGSVELDGAAAHTRSDLDAAGVATLIVSDAHAGQTYQVQVMLKEAEAPLGFTIQLQ